MYVYICSSPNSNDIPRWQKVIMMTSGRIFKKNSSVFVLHFHAASNRLGLCTLLLSDFLNVPSNSFPEQLKTCSGYTSAFSPEWLFKCLLKSLPWTDEKSHWLHLFCFCPECRHKWCARVNFKSHWCYLCGLSEVFRCPLKRPASAHAWSLWLHLDNFSPEGVLKCTQKWLAFEDA